MTKAVARKSCPFCESLYNSVRREQHYGRRVWIECHQCQARGPVCTTYAGACKAWNDRAAHTRYQTQAKVLKFRPRVVA